MGSTPAPSASARLSGFHEGELAVQRQAGASLDARRLERMLDLPDLSGGAERFLADRTFAVLTGRGSDGRLWTSPLRGPAGFLHGSDRTLRIAGSPGPGDPLHGIEAGQQVGLVAIEFAARRRVRVNGRLVSAGQDLLELEVDQAYGNCPQYIQRRTFLLGEQIANDGSLAERAVALSAADRVLVSAADTLFLGTAHPSRGADASHRGGPAGFVRTDGAELWWPDLRGNNMFNSLGNLAVSPEAALLFIDWSRGATLAVSGAAALEWVDQEAAPDVVTGRRVRFAVDAVVRRPDLSLRARTA